MYISATPSENTINFYLHRGCEVTPDPDPELFKLEPEDIHLVCEVRKAHGNREETFHLSVL